MRGIKSIYRDCKYGAKERSIEFLLTFDEWLKIWIDSGHFHERGRSNHQYQMARFGDKGPYTVGNVRIITCAENHAEFCHTKEQRDKISKNTLGKKKAPFSLQARANMAKGHRGLKRSRESIEKAVKTRKTSPNYQEMCDNISKALKGRVFTIEHRQKLSKPKSLEHRKKLSEIRKGKHLSEEHKQKIKEGGERSRLLKKAV